MEDLNSAMATFELLTVLAVLLVAGSVIAFMIYSERKARAARIEISQSLGFFPVDPSPELVNKITELYVSFRSNPRNMNAPAYRLENVSSRRMLNYEAFLFDLVNTSGDEESTTEVQAVGIVSRHLTLPHFTLLPRANIDGPLTGFANKVMGWVVSGSGNRIEFPESPEFGRGYLVSSRDPDGTRRFLNDRRLQRLANTRLLVLHAGGNMFTLSRVDTTGQAVTTETISGRVAQAEELFAGFNG